MSSSKILNVDDSVNDADQEKEWVGKVEAVEYEGPVDRARVAWKEKHGFFFFLFVFLAFGTSVVEVVLVGLPEAQSTASTGQARYSDQNFNAQVAILAVSSLLALLGIAFTIDNYPSPSIMDDGTERVLTLYEKITLTFDAEVVTELFFLIWGWSSIFYAPGIAALRCVRILRYFWYFELVDYVEPAKPEDHFVSFTKVSKLMVFYLESLINEFITQKSRGGVLVMAIFGLITYIFGVIMHMELTQFQNVSEGASCDTVVLCSITLLRLALYDGTGLDFLQAVEIAGKHGLTALLVIYLIFSAIVLLNGLIGIFGNVFTEQDDTLQDTVDDLYAMVKMIKADIKAIKNSAKIGTPRSN